MITESGQEPVDVVAALRDSKSDVLVCYLPVGSEIAARFYAQCATDAGVGFVNALPVFIASDPVWAARFTASDAIRAYKIALDRGDGSLSLLPVLTL